MDTSKIIAILNKADPLHNSNYQERQVALSMAHKAMDRQGLSYASLGYSQVDAERIENQFSVTSGHAGNAGSSRTGYHWWNPFSWGRFESEAPPESKQKPYNDNGREYNPASGDWEYTAEANGNADPFECN